MSTNNHFKKSRTFITLLGVGLIYFVLAGGPSVLAEANIALYQTFSANTNSADAYKACDGDSSTYWSGTSSPYGDNWLKLEFNEYVRFNQITLSENSGTTTAFSIYFLDRNGASFGADSGTSIGSAGSPTVLEMPYTYEAKEIWIDYVSGSGTPQLCEFEIRNVTASINKAVYETAFITSYNSADAYKAFDQDPNTYWQGDGSNYANQFCFVNFNRVVNANRVRICENGGTTTYAHVAYKDLTGNWQYATSVIAGIGSPSNPTEVTFDTIYATAIGIDYYQGSGNLQLVEFEVYYDQEAIEAPEDLVYDPFVRGFDEVYIPRYQSGWVVGEGGGTFDYDSTCPTPREFAWTIRMNDTSSTNGMGLSKNFVPHDSGIITYEFKFWEEDDVFDGPRFVLGGDSNDAVVMTVASSKLQYVKSDASLLDLTGTLSTGVVYAVKVVANLSTDKVDIYVNGDKKTGANGESFTEATDVFDFISIGTGYAGAGVLQLLLTAVHHGYDVNERMLCSPVPTSPATEINELPDDWSAYRGGGQVGTAELLRSSHSSDYKSMYINDTSSSAMAYAYRYFPDRTDKVLWQFRFMMPSVFSGFAASLDNSSAGSVRLQTGNSNLYYVKDGPQFVSIWNGLKNNVWYTVTVELDTHAGSDDTATIYVNGKEVASGTDTVRDKSNMSYVDRLLFSVGSTETGKVYLDDIQVGEFITREAPEPDPELSATYMVGAQFMTGSREGGLLGWKNLDQYNDYGFRDKKPLLGWFDEGSQFVSDWEIKWALEHGIGFFLFDWFRAPNKYAATSACDSAILTDDVPVKDYLLDPPIENGFKRATNRSSMKFAIQWCLAPTLGELKNANDMYENVMPYFIENFFKTGYYMTTSDNKPILAIYNPMRLVANLGSASVIHDMLDECRTMTANAGFGGLVIIAEYRGGEYYGITPINTLINCGFDYIYQYCFNPVDENGEVWEYLTESEAMNYQQDVLTYQRTTADGDIEIIPSVGMGFDTTACDPIAPFYQYQLSAANYYNQCIWVRDTFVPPTIDPAGHKLVLLDNWSEYHEGHYIAPHAGADALEAGKQAGFGYLDAVRKAFSTTASHTDEFPDITLERLCPSLW